MTQSLVPQDLMTSGSAAAICRFLTGPDTTVRAGLQALEFLEQTRPDVANEVLCRLYDVACYETEKVFPGSSEPGRWFASVLVGSDLDDGTEVPTADDLEQVRANAVRHLGLREKFFEQSAAALA